MKKQCFYLVVHKHEYDYIVDKVFLQESEAIKWGRRFATQNLESIVDLYKQEITRNSILQYVKELKPFYN